ncbi:MAG TPA: hypothetical protein VGK67_11085 [Myxococcales bacterium]
MRNLLCACSAAVLTLALTACPPPADDKKDSNDLPGLDASTGHKDASVSPDTGVPLFNDGGVGLDACTPKCDARECGPDGCGGTCGTTACAEGTKCNPAGVCAPMTCDKPVGPCGTDQYCDTTGTDPACVEICAPVGCQAGETCVHDTPTSGHCQPPTCPPWADTTTGTVCKPGQNCDETNPGVYWAGGSSWADCFADTDCTKAGEACIEFSDGKACVAMPCTCTPAFTLTDGTSFEDSCASIGMVCPIDIYDSAAWVPSECRKPVENEECDVKVGCEQAADGGQIDCVSGIYTISICLRSCKNAAGASDHSMCPNTTEICGGLSTKYHCTENDCVPYCKGLNCTKDADRAKFFKPCNSLKLGDSTCIPIAQEYQGTVYEWGLCEQNGTAPSLGKCDPNAARAQGQIDFPTVCPTGEFCSGVRPATATDTWTGAVGKCTKYCNAYTGTNPAPVPTGLGCSGAAGDYCADAIGVPGLLKSILGICFTKCDPFGDVACPDNGIGDKQGCYPENFTSGSGICVGLQPTVGAQGDACLPTPADKNEKREACADRLVCQVDATGNAGKCVGWCHSATCSDPTAVCGECVGTACVACTPSCTGKCNGETDGCGGTCGCDVGQKCDTAAATNVCVACPADACLNKCNGQSDGCGGTCGCATSGDKCDIRNPAAEACYTPVCTGLCNGEGDGFGGTCGCPVGKKCDVAATPNACVDCVPVCTDMCSGQPDGCGGTCGCPVGKKCDVSATPNACIDCVADCAGKCSGQPNGCGGTCGCAAGKKCDTAASPNACIDCVPNCYMRSCGDDGCGGTCGPACGTGEICDMFGENEKCVTLDQDASGNPVSTPIQICDFK